MKNRSSDGLACISLLKRRRFIRVVGYLFLIIVLSAVGLACGWDYLSDRSVRLSYRTGREFYRLPPLPVMFDKDSGKPLSNNDERDVHYFEQKASTGPAISDSKNDPWNRAVEAVNSRKLSAAEASLKEFLKISDAAYMDEDPDDQQKRNAAVDMLDAMSALGKGASQDSVAQYLDARLALPLLTSNSLADTTIASTDKNLADNWAYLSAAAKYLSDDKATAQEEFTDLPRKFPNSEKKEAALYMTAKLLMESSELFTNDRCGIISSGRLDNSAETAPEDADKCKDENGEAALIEFQRLLRNHPNGRYAVDARGWIAFLHKRGGDRAKALAEYYKLLGHPTDIRVRASAERSLKIIGLEYEDKILDEVEKLISGDASASLAYAYHRIYYYAVDLTYRDALDLLIYAPSPHETDTNAEVSKANLSGDHELKRIVSFASKMARRHPKAALSGAFLLRIAQASLELKNYSEALTFSKKALSHDLDDTHNLEALWIKGSAEHALKRFKTARSTFSELLRQFPHGEPAEQARRLLAITAEDQGDLAFALDQYIALNYQPDIAYFVDVLLPTDKLADYVQSRPNSPYHNGLLYSLGIRYMRDKRWMEAREAFTKVRTSQNSLTGPYYESYQPRSVKEPRWEDGESMAVYSKWVMRDLKMIDVLERMERDIELAGNDDERKAEAMYQYASYIYEEDDLLFYNPLMWKGLRTFMLYHLQTGEHTRLPGETQNIFEHSQRHDSLSRALEIYLQIADLYPNTRAAKDALYTAAVAHERLSNLNYYWRSAYEDGLFAGQRMVTYRTVRSTYPNYQLPRGTNGWEPMTRTVNGRSGWEPAPKPIKTTRIQRFEHRIRYAVDKFDIHIRPKLADIATGYANIGSAFTAYIRSMIEALIAVIYVMLIGYSIILVIHYKRSAQNGPNSLPPEFRRFKNPYTDDQSHRH